MEYKNFNEDLLNRKPIAENLLSILKSNSDVKVLAIDSKWGTGKTTFVNMWADLIYQSYNMEFDTLYFNAWENDYLSDPLISIIAELDSQISNYDECKKGFYERNKDKIAPVLKVLGKTALSCATKGALNEVDWGSITESGLTDISKQLGDIAFKERNISKNSRKVLKEELQKFQQQLNKKIIFFIDELDRCRPTYAIELLETIKHIFDIDNFIFIIALDKNQLSQSIKTIYGQNMDSDGYLRRFFDLEYRLPLNQELKDYVKNICKELDTKFNNIAYFKRFMEEIFYQESYSLRDINKTFNYIKIILPMINEFNIDNDKKYNESYMLLISYLYMFFINLKIRHNDKLDKIINGKYINDIDCIKKELIDIDKDAMNLKFNTFDDIRAKEMIEGAVEKYILLLNDIKYYGKNTSYYYRQNFPEDRYEVGIKKDDGSYFYDCNYNLGCLYDNLNIIDKLNFIDGFNIN